MKYKVGDKVKLLINACQYKIGDIHVITKTYDNAELSICLGVGSTETGFRPSELELVKKQSIPEHYKTDSIDVIDFVKIYNLNFNLGNIVKYVCRDKGSDIEDLEKVIDYAQREIKHLKSLDK